MRRLQDMCRLGLVAALWFGGAQAFAVPEFEIGSGTSTPWAVAMQGIEQGRVRPVMPGPDSLTYSAIEFYGSQGGPFELHPSLLVPDQLFEGETALMMGWEPPTTGMAIAAWQFDYGDDPSLIGRWIRFTVNAPPGIWDVSLELIDVNGLSRGWFLPMPPLGWHIYEIDPSSATPPTGWVFVDQPGFDLSQVVSIRLDESGRVGVFPVPPPFFPPFFQWNAWDSLRVIRAPINTTVPGLIVSPFAGQAAGLPPLASPKFGLIETPGASPFLPEMYIDELGSPEVVRVDPIGNAFRFTNPFPMPSVTYGLDIDGVLENLKAPTRGMYGGAGGMYCVPAGGAPLHLVRPNGAWAPVGLATGNVPGAAQAQFDRTPGFLYGGFLYLSDWGGDGSDGIYQYMPPPLGATVPFAAMPGLDIRYFTFDLTGGATGYGPGNLWATSFNSGQLFSVMPNGAFAPRAVLAPGIEGLAFGTGQDLFTRELYVANLNRGTVEIVSPAGFVRPFINGLPGAAYLMFVDTGPYAFRGNPSLYILDGRDSIWVVYHCLADFDDGSFTGTPDGGVTIDDLLWYLYVFERGFIAADVDDGSFTGTRDGGVTIDDLLYFLYRFEVGC